MTRYIIIPLFAFFLSNALFAQNIVFEDEWFKEELRFLGIDTNGDGEISISEAEVVTSIFIEIPYLEPSITNLSGIEYFINLDSLSIPGPEVRSAILNSNRNLKFLDLEGNYDLDTLEIDSLKLIETLFLNNIGAVADSLDFTNLHTLKELHISCSNINLSANTALESLGITGLDSLDLSYNPLLKRLNTNSVRKLNLTVNTNLEYLTCMGVTELDISKNINLVYLNCLTPGTSSLDGLQSLDLTNNTKLRFLDCSQNKLSEIDLSQNEDLETFRGSWNPFGTIDLSNNPKLTSFRCNVCELNEMDLTNNPDLNFLNCSSNELESLDVSNNIKLNTLYCGLNLLEILDLSRCSSLEKLDCGENNLTEILFPKTCSLREVWCQNNKLTNVNIRACTDLEGIHFFYNNLESLDLSKNRKAQWVQISHNENMEEVCVWELPLPEGLTIPLHGCPKAFLIVCLDVIQKYISNEILVYPNPVQSWLTIQGLEYQKPIIIYISDMKSGITMVESQNITGTSEEIYIGDLDPGAYIITIHSEDLCYSAKFLKN